MSITYLEGRQQYLLLLLTKLSRVCCVPDTALAAGKKMNKSLVRHQVGRHLMSITINLL